MYNYTPMKYIQLIVLSGCVMMNKKSEISDRKNQIILELEFSENLFIFLSFYFSEILPLYGNIIIDILNYQEPVTTALQEGDL